VVLNRRAHSVRFPYSKINFTEGAVFAPLHPSIFISRKLEKTALSLCKPYQGQCLSREARAGTAFSTNLSTKLLKTFSGKKDEPLL
jgi:hypothetical protein